MFIDSQLAVTVPPPVFAERVSRGVATRAGFGFGRRDATASWLLFVYWRRRVTATHAMFLWSVTFSADEMGLGHSRRAYVGGV